MSGKRAKKVRKSKSVSKKSVAICAGLCLSTVPLVADGEFLVSVYPHFSKPLGDSHKIESGIGAGLKLTYRPVNFLNVYATGDYYSFSLPNVAPVSVFDGGIGIGYHLGISDRFAMDLNLNGGVYSASMKRSVQSFYAGAQLTFTYKINPIIYTDVNAEVGHYASGSSPLIPLNLGLSPGITFNLTEAFKGSQKLKMQEKSMDPVFPVLYSWYENNPFGKVQITNEEDSSITDVTVSFYQPQYMGQPKVCSTVAKLNKDESIDVDLYAFFNEQMLELTEKTNTQAIVTVNYSCLGQKRTKAFDITVPVYGRNNMSWDDDRRAAVFVSSKDPAAMLFAKYVTSIVRDNVRNGVPINIQYAMGIFETLDQFGLNYVVDPTSAFEDNVGTSAIDFLQFPYQTLMYRGGDCDDLSILVSSLFEAVGIRTAFITIPGHIYMAFDSGLTARQATAEFSSLSDLIVLDNEVWVPLEITLTDEGFNKAWRVGAREWNTANAGGVAAIYRMSDSWKSYQPISVPGANSYFTLPDDDIVAKLFDHSVDEWISKEIDPQIKMYQAKLAVKDDVKTRNNLGVLYGKYGLFIQADNEFKQARRKGYTPSIINTGNVYFSRQNYTLARKWYKSVLKEDPNNTLALIGVARCDYELAEYEECDAAYNKVIQLDPDLASEYSYLGSFVYNKGRSFSLADRLSKTIWDGEEDEVSEKIKKVVDSQRPLGENEAEINEVPISESMVDDIFDFELEGVAIAPAKTLEEDDEDYEHLEEESELEGGDPPPEPEFIDENPENTNEIVEVDISSFAEDFNGLVSEVSIDTSKTLESLEKAAEPVIAVTPQVTPIVREIPKKVETKTENKVAQQEVASPVVNKVAEAPTELPVVNTIAKAETELPVENKVAQQEVASPVVNTIAEAPTELPVVNTIAKAETELSVENKVAQQEVASPVVNTIAEVPAELPVVNTIAKAETELPVENKVAQQEVASPVVNKVAEAPTELPVENKVAQQEVASPVVSKVTEAPAELPVVNTIAKAETELPVENKVAQQEVASPVVNKVTEAPTELPVVNTIAKAEAELPVENKVAQQEVASPVVNKVAEAPAELPVVNTIAKAETELPVENKVAQQEVASPVENKVAQQEVASPVVNKVAEAPTELPVVNTIAKAETELPVENKVAQQEVASPVVNKVAEAPTEYETDFYDVDDFIEELDLDLLLAQEEELNTFPTVTEIADFEIESSVSDTIAEVEIESPNQSPVEETFAPLIAQDVIQEEIIPFAVPRFTEQPSAEWAPEEAYVAETIPGMKSFEEEMGEFQNEKSFLYEDEVAIEYDPDHDVDEIKTKEDNSDKFAMAGIPDVDPFSSYLSKEDAKVVSQITNYNIDKVKAEAKVVAKEVVEAVSDKLETVKQESIDKAEVIEHKVESVVEKVEQKAEIITEKVEQKPETITEKVEQKPEIITETVEHKTDLHTENTTDTVASEENVDTETNENSDSEKKSHSVLVILIAVVAGIIDVIAVKKSKKDKKDKKGEN